MKKLFALAAFATLSATVTVHAAPLATKDVADDPAILAHVDIDALRESSLGKAILAEPDLQNKLSAVAALFNFDLRTQLHGATVYTREDFPKQGVLIVYADFDPARLEMFARAAEGSQSATNGSHVIYSWLDDKKKNKDDRKRIYGAIDGHRVVFGQDDKDVEHALAVIDGSAPTYTDKGSLPAAEPGESVIVQGVVLKFPFDSTDQNAAIFKMSKSVRIKLSEASTNINARVQFEATDADTAAQISAIANGLVAVLKLQKSDATALELANAINIKQTGSTVNLALTLPSEELYDKLKAKHEEEMKKKAAHADAEKGAKQ